MKVQILSRWDSSKVLFECEVPNNVPSGLAMRHALERATAANAYLSGADLSDAYLRGAYLRGADLRDANLSGADLSGADLRDANLSGAYLRDANLSDANLSGADLRGANLRGADLSGANLSDADLSGANLSGANLSGANLSGADLSGANLRGANLRGANLRGADLSGANLSGAYLSDADLSDADLSGANLSGAYLSGAYLSGADGKQLPRATPEQAIENLDKVREIVLDDKARLNMGHWHGSDEWRNRTCAEETLCGTTHCMAGWLQVCTTEQALKSVSPQLAGALAAPIALRMFHRGDSEAFEWLRDRKYVAETEAYEKRGAELKARREAAKVAA